MTLATGSRVGAYEILSPLGAGGMGEVYRARDTKLQRDVALKVLPAAFAADADRLARLGLEARLLASLNHPNIAAIHGVEEGPTAALVLELVDGSTLAERLASGPLPLGEALAVARQIADALAAAHEHSVIHRDLKPANVKVRTDGTVKVLDFGLAKALEDGPGPNDGKSPTLVSPAMTQLGMILGTAAYMSPEQARGFPADKRSDVWAFGCVLFEMLTGKRAFDGDEVADAIAAVLRADPTWSELPANTPASIRRLLRRCLTKDAKRRLADIRDARLELDDATADTAGEQPAPRRPRWREGAAWLIAALATAAAAWVLIDRPRDERAGDRAPAQLELAAPEGASFARQTAMAAISRDGSRLAFVATAADGVARLWVRPLDAASARELPGTGGAALPFWSPDGESIGFFTGDALKRVDLQGGPPQTLARVTSIGLGAAWGANGVILFAPGIGAALKRVDARGGGPATDVLAIPDGTFAFTVPQFLPDGRRFIVTAIRAADASEVLLASLEGGDAPVRLMTGVAAAYAYAPGYLLSVEAGSVVARAFDADRAAVAQDTARLPFPAPDMAGPFAPMSLSASANGILIHHASSAASELRWADRTGADLGVAAPRGTYGNFVLSPDARRIAFDAPAGGSVDVWVFDSQRQVRTRLTTSVTSNVPVWSPDGSRIAFARSGDSGGALDIFARAATGAGTDELLARLESAPIMFPSDWSADGQFVAFYRTVGLQLDTWIAPLSGEPFAFLASEFSESQGQFSPNGRWFAYVSDQSGQPEVYVTSFPSPGGIEQISAAGGSQPRWSRDGRELFYVAADGALMSVEVATGESFGAGAPRRLFATALERNPVRQSYAVTNDGRFLLAVDVASESSIRVLIDWPALLDR